MAAVDGVVSAVFSQQGVVEEQVVGRYCHMQSPTTPLDFRLSPLVSQLAGRAFRLTLSNTSASADEPVDLRQ